MNELVILTNGGQIPISVDDLFQNMFGHIVVKHEGKHFNLKQLLEFDFEKDEEE